MNTSEQVERMRFWLDGHPAPRLPRDPVADLDEDTLWRMRVGGLSVSARRVERGPVSQVPDELGYAPSGVWVPESDPWRRSA